MPARSVLITGAAGVLGTWLRRAAPEDVSVTALVHRTPVDAPHVLVADLRRPDEVRRAVEATRPSLVIHAAYRRDEDSIVSATGHVVEAAAAVGAALLHISSDAVFAGDGVPQAEDAVPAPVWDYGRWKAQAEELVAGAMPDAAVARLPLIVSLAPLDHIATDLRDGATVWFDDEVRQPANADELAAALWRIAALEPSARAGVWHLPGPERLTRPEIARRIAAALGLDARRISAQPTPPGAQRPRDLVLHAARAERALGWAPRPILT